MLRRLARPSAFVVHRRRVAIPALVIALAAAAGCGAGQGNETQQESNSVQGAHATIGPILIQDIYITPVGEDIAPPPGASLAAPDVTSVSPSPVVTPSVITRGQVDGYLVATLIDTSTTGSDQLTGVTVQGGTAQPTPAGVNLTVAHLGTLNLADPADPQSTGGPYITISGMTSALSIGLTVPVTFTMASAGTSQTINVPIISSTFGTPPPTPPGGTSSVLTRGPAGSGAGSPALPTHTTSASP